ncbi:MAG: serine/threonine-protein kinase [Byssovorax sp.]
MVTAGHELRDTLIGAVIEGSAGTSYHVRSLLGEGGQGWVFKASRDRPDGELMVVKVLRPECVHSDSLQRFQREAEVMRRLGAVPSPNPHIVRFYDYATLPASPLTHDTDIPFIVLELVDGQTLATVIKAHGGFGLPVGRVRRLMKQVARALHTVHEQRIVHRDLKPSNILLTQHGGQEVAKVTDFGLVKLPDLSINKTISVAGASLGYAPPEQYEMGNNRVSAQTDIFAFAAVLFELLSGIEAFPLKGGESPLRVVARMLSGDRPTLAKVTATVPRELRDRPDLTAAIDREISRALSPDPAMRHRSIRELWNNLEPLLVDALLRAGSADDPATSDVGLPAPVPPVAAPMPEWKIAGRPLAGERLRAAYIGGDRGAILAVGAHGLYRFAQGAWSAVQLPGGIDPKAIRGLARGPAGELILFGDGGLAASIARTGAAERLFAPDRDLALFGAHADEHGVILVGERGTGVLIELPRGGAARPRSFEPCARLCGVTRLAGGTILACGTQGDLFELIGANERPIPWGRTGHLYAAIATPDGGAFAVGSGGHALRISPPATLPGFAGPPVATLEAVQTTRDLTGLALDDDGSAWAVGGQARLVHRRGGVWMRIPLDPAAQGPIVAVRPRRDGITVLVEDGLVLEGPGSAVGSEPVGSPSGALDLRGDRFSA